MAESFVNGINEGNPSYSSFDLSYDKKFSCDMGQLIPVLHEEMVPGDVFNIGAQCLVRFNPLNAPIMHRVDLKAWYFFIPYRLLWDDWEDFITGGEDGNFSGTVPFYGMRDDGTAWFQRPGSVNAALPWDSRGEYNIFSSTPNNARYLMGVGSLWDYFGLPVVGQAVAGFSGPAQPWNSPTGTPTPFSITDPTLSSFGVVDFPRRAYNLVFREYFRDENFDRDETLEDDSTATVASFEDLYDLAGFASYEKIDSNFLVRSKRWTKDYFTSALPWRTKGAEPFVPVFDPSVDDPAVYFDGDSNARYSTPADSRAYGGLVGAGPVSTGTDHPLKNLSGYTEVDGGPGVLIHANMNDFFSTSGFSIHALREAAQLTKWLERTASGGSRYTEVLKTHFKQYPRDDRLQRPEYIGGIQFPALFNEVLQTSEDSDISPQGNMAGHGIAAESLYVGKYHAVEYGMVLGIFCACPVPSYEQGINRQWLRRSKWDYYWPEFSHLSEQAIYLAEIYTGGPGTMQLEPDTFGYQGIYNEMRYKPNLVCGLFRMNASTSFDYWHLGRQFSSPPVLGSSFVRMTRERLFTPDGRDGSVDSGNVRKDIFADMTTDGILVNYGNSVEASRPLPYIAEPGFLDHL